MIETGLLDRPVPPATGIAAPLRRRLKEALLRRILGGHYAPGERLVELRLAAEFETSQGPVREALRELEATGLVTNIPRRGTYVAEVVAEGLREIHTVRGALEEQATRLVTARGTADLLGLQRALDGMRTAAARRRHGPPSSPTRWRSTAPIMQAAGNRLLLDIRLSLQIETRTTITMLVDGLDLVGDRRQPSAHPRRHSLPGDAEAAARIAREHQDYFDACRSPPARRVPHRPRRPTDRPTPDPPAPTASRRPTSRSWSGRRPMTAAPAIGLEQPRPAQRPGNRAPRDMRCRALSGVCPLADQRDRFAPPITNAGATRPHRSIRKLAANFSR